jgi:hypothetical protein
MKVVGFETAFRRGGLRKQIWNTHRGTAHHAVIFSHPDAELDDGALGIPSGVRPKAMPRSRPNPPGVNLKQGLL